MKGSTVKNTTPKIARNYKDVQRYLSELTPFAHRSCSAAWTRDGRYTVFSYNTAVAHYDPETELSTVAENRWSATTGKHIGHCRRCLPRVGSNDPDAVRGIGPRARVQDSVGVKGYVRELYPLSGRAVYWSDGGRWNDHRYSRGVRRVTSIDNLKVI